MPSPPRRTSKATSHQALPSKGEALPFPSSCRNATKRSASIYPCAMREGTTSAARSRETSPPGVSSTSMHTPSSQTTFRPSTNVVSETTEAVHKSAAMNITAFMPYILPNFPALLCKSLSMFGKLFQEIGGLKTETGLPPVIHDYARSCAP